MATKFNIKRVMKELKDLELDPPAGIICYSKDDSLKELEARIKGPPDTPYSKGEFKLKITLPNNYPLSPPSVIFQTPIYHPNIDESGVICLDILKKGNSGKWSPVQTLSTILISLTVLLSDPNPDDPLRKEVADVFRRNPIQFRKSAEDFTIKYATSEPGSVNASDSSKSVSSSSEPKSNITDTLEEDRSLSEPPKKLKKQSLSLRKKGDFIGDIPPRSSIITKSPQFTPSVTKFDDVYQACVYNKSILSLSPNSKNSSEFNNGKRKLNLGISSNSVSSSSLQIEKGHKLDKNNQIMEVPSNQISNELEYSSSSSSNEGSCKIRQSKKLKLNSAPMLKSKYFGKSKSILSSQPETISNQGLIVDKNLKKITITKVMKENYNADSFNAGDEELDTNLHPTEKEESNPKNLEISKKSNSQEIQSNTKEEGYSKISKNNILDNTSSEMYLQNDGNESNLNTNKPLENSKLDDAIELEIDSNKGKSDNILKQYQDLEKELSKLKAHENPNNEIILISSSDTESPPGEAPNQLSADLILDSPIQVGNTLNKLVCSQNSNFSIGSPPLSDQEIILISDTEEVIDDNVKDKIPATKPLEDRSQSSQVTQVVKPKPKLMKFKSASDSASSSKAKSTLKTNSPFSIFANSRFGKTNTDEVKSLEIEEVIESPKKPSSQLFTTTNASSTQQDFRSKWGVDPAKFKTKSINLTLKRK